MPVQTSYYQFGSWNREILHNLFFLLLLFSFLALSCWAYAFIEIHCTAKTWRVLVWATCWSSLSTSRQCKIIYIYIYNEISLKKKIKLNKNCLCLCLPFPCYNVSVVNGGTCSFWRKESKYDEKNTLLYQRCVGFFSFFCLHIQMWWLLYRILWILRALYVLWVERPSYTKATMKQAWSIPEWNGISLAVVSNHVWCALSLQTVEDAKIMGHLSHMLVYRIADR